MMKALLPDNDWESDQRLKSGLRGQRFKRRSTNSPFQLWRSADKSPVSDGVAIISRPLTSTGGYLGYDVENHFQHSDKIIHRQWLVNHFLILFEWAAAFLPGWRRGPRLVEDGGVVIRPSRR
ncbi:MAG TPA: hypothetical protein VJ464_06765 [Blastocatellia bacterium]|nr:hypothetical protein [Blastocatellia bacterium]